MRHASEGVGFVKRVARSIRKILGDDKVVQIEYGYRNDDLSLTEKGKDAVLNFVSQTKEVNDELTSLATEEKDEDEKECKK